MRCVSSNCKIPVIPHPNNEKFLALFSQEICGEHRRFGGPVGAENLPAGHQGLPGPRRRRVGEQEEASASVLCTLTMNFGLSRLCFSHFSRRHDKSSRQWRLTIAHNLLTKVCILRLCSAMPCQCQLLVQLLLTVGGILFVTITISPLLIVMECIVVHAVHSGVVCFREE